MSIRSALAWFFAPDPNNAHIGPPGAQGMIILDRTPPKTVDQVRSEQTALPPRTWTLVEGHGLQIGTAVEKDDKTILVTWVGDKPPTRRLWVDYRAFEEGVTATHRGSFANLNRITTPIRIRYQPRTPAEAEEQQFQDELEAQDFDG